MPLIIIIIIIIIIHNLNINATYSAQLDLGWVHPQVGSGLEITVFTGCVEIR